MERLSTLLRADAHGVVDALEEPALLLRQNLREAAAELDRKRARIEAMRGEEERLQREQERLSGRLEELDRDVSLALEAEEKDLARFSIRKLLPVRRACRELAERAEALRRDRQHLEEKLQEQEACYSDLEAQVKARLAHLEEQRSGAGLAPEAPVSDEEVELELLRRREEPS